MLKVNKSVCVCLCIIIIIINNNINNIINIIIITTMVYNTVLWDNNTLMNDKYNCLIYNFKIGIRVETPWLTSKIRPAYGRLSQHHYNVTKLCSIIINKLHTSQHTYSLHILLEVLCFDHIPFPRELCHLYILGRWWYRCYL